MSGGGDQLGWKRHQALYSVLRVNGTHWSKAIPGTRKLASSPGRLVLCLLIRSVVNDPLRSTLKWLERGQGGSGNFLGLAESEEAEF